MKQDCYTFSAFSEHVSTGIFQALSECVGYSSMPVFLCIGSDLVLGDSLGPLVGTFLKNKGVNSYIYGTLNFPVTAKEIENAKTYLKGLHPYSKIVAIDAAVGNADDVGIIRVLDKGLKPGLGVDKNLGQVGDVSIIGVVSAKSLQNYSLFNATRLNLVYKMAEQISLGIYKYVSFINNNSFYIKNNTFNA